MPPNATINRRIVLNARPCGAPLERPHDGAQGANQIVGRRAIAADFFGHQRGGLNAQAAGGIW